MSLRLNKKFRDIYKPKSFTTPLVAPHFVSMKSLAGRLSCRSEKTLEILSLLICKLISLHSSTGQHSAEQRLLYESCMTHLSMHGFAVVKLLEQAAQALDMTTEEFAPHICTTLVKSSLDNVFILFRTQDKPVNNLALMGTEYS